MSRSPAIPVSTFLLAFVLAMAVAVASMVLVMPLRALVEKIENAPAASAKGPPASTRKANAAGTKSSDSIVAFDQRREDKNLRIINKYTGKVTPADKHGGPAASPSNANRGQGSTTGKTDGKGRSNGKGQGGPANNNEEVSKHSDSTPSDPTVHNGSNGPTSHDTSTSKIVDVVKSWPQHTTALTDAGTRLMSQLTTLSLPPSARGDLGGADSATENDTTSDDEDGQDSLSNQTSDQTASQDMVDGGPMLLGDNDLDEGQAALRGTGESALSNPSGAGGTDNSGAGGRRGIGTSRGTQGGGVGSAAGPGQATSNGVGSGRRTASGAGGGGNGSGSGPGTDQTAPPGAATAPASAVTFGGPAGGNMPPTPEAPSSARIMALARAMARALTGSGGLAHPEAADVNVPKPAPYRAPAPARNASRHSPGNRSVQSPQPKSNPSSDRQQRSPVGPQQTIASQTEGNGISPRPRASSTQPGDNRQARLETHRRTATDVVQKQPQRFEPTPPVPPKPAQKPPSPTTRESEQSHASQVAIGSQSSSTSKPGGQPGTPAKPHPLKPADFDDALLHADLSQAERDYHDLLAHKVRFDDLSVARRHNLLTVLQLAEEAGRHADAFHRQTAQEQKIADVFFRQRSELQKTMARSRRTGVGANLVLAGDQASLVALNWMAKYDPTDTARLAATEYLAVREAAPLAYRLALAGYKKMPALMRRFRENAARDVELARSGKEAGVKDEHGWLDLSVETKNVVKGAHETYAEYQRNTSRGAVRAAYLPPSHAPASAGKTGFAQKVEDRLSSLFKRHPPSFEDSLKKVDLGLTGLQAASQARSLYRANRRHDTSGEITQGKKLLVSVTSLVSPDKPYAASLEHGMKAGDYLAAAKRTYTSTRLAFSSQLITRVRDRPIARRQLARFAAELQGKQLPNALRQRISL